MIGCRAGTVGFCAAFFSAAFFSAAFFSAAFFWAAFFWAVFFAPFLAVFFAALGGGLSCPSTRRLIRPAVLRHATTGAGPSFRRSRSGRGRRTRSEPLCCPRVGTG